MIVDSKTGLFCAQDMLFSFSENSMVLLILKFNKALFDHGVPPNILVRNSKFGLIPMLNYYCEVGQDTYHEDVTEQFVIDIHKRCKAGELKWYFWKNSRRMATVLLRFVKNGYIDLRPSSPWGLRQPNPHFKLLLDNFIDDLKATGAVADSTIHLSWSSVRGLLFVFEDNNITDINQVDYKCFSDCMTSFASRFRGGLGKMVYSIKLFVKYLYRTQTIQYDLERAIPQFPEYRKHCIDGFTDEEILSILNSVNTNTPIGKRDYAVFTLAAQTSLRAVDIAKIKRSDIDWHKNELRIIQAKTGQGIIYPLLPESGNAIADYLLHGRPSGGEPYVFVTHQGITRQIEANSLIARLRTHLKKAGISSGKGRRAFHSFRRSVATNLLDNEVSLEMMQQITGQRDYRSAKRYLSINEKGLMQCCLSFPQKEEM